MKSPEEISLIKQRRQGLRKWLIDQETTLKSLADTLGIKPPTLDAHLNKKTMPVDYHTKLVEEREVPEEFLPDPMNLRPGPQPKSSGNAHAQTRLTG